MPEATDGAREDARPELFCCGCDKRPSQIGEFLDTLYTDGQDPDDYVWENEGTLNRETGLFACTQCYLVMGQPANPYPEPPWTPPTPNPLYFTVRGWFKSVDAAMVHAVLVQGGFTTEAIEAERMTRERGDSEQAQHLRALGAAWIAEHASEMPL